MAITRRRRRDLEAVLGSSPNPQETEQGNILVSAAGLRRAHRAGRDFAIRFKPFIGQSEGRVTVSEYEPPRRMVLRGQMGKMAPTVVLTVDPQTEGSRSRAESS